ncbi:hypothetical protein FACS1894219_10600 [Clostridia bacterium]|nr:hypothetical protein FACS1894219_10600 [Clostridia bacterium]
MLSNFFKQKHLLEGKGMNANKLFKKLTAVMLSIITIIGMIPLSVSAKSTQANTTNTEGEIISFAPLDEEVSTQVVPLGVEAPSLNLPQTLIATVSTVSSPAIIDVIDDEESQDDDLNKESTSESNKVEINNIDVPVTWQSSPEYNSSLPGSYVFTPLFGVDYIVTATPPAITVITVEFFDVIISDSFVDTNFLNAVLDVLGKSAGDAVYASEVETIAYLNLTDKDIENLSGIEHFKSLETLIVNGNHLVGFDISNNSALTWLDARNNDMKVSSDVTGWEKIGLTLGVDFLFDQQNTGDAAVDGLLTGFAGDDLSWTLDPDTGLLEIDGNGTMWDWSENNPAPWYGNRDLIQSVYIHPYVKNVGTRAFAGLAYLRTVNIPDSISDIGSGAYTGSINLINVNVYKAPSLFRAMSVSTAANPGLDRLLSGFNILSGNELRRMTTNQLITDVGRESLEELNKTAGFMSYKPGNRATYNYYAASSMEEFADKQGIDVTTKLGAGDSVESNNKASVNFGKVKFGAAFKASASYRYDLNEFTSSSSSFKSAYETFYSSLEVHRELGTNSIGNPQSLRSQNTQIWEALSPGVRDALITGEVGDLFGIYGTHVLTSYAFGGRAEHFVGIVKTSAESQTSIRDEIFVEQKRNEETSFGGSAGVDKLGSLSTDNNFNKTSEFMQKTIEAAERLSKTGKYDYTARSIVFGA